MGKIKKFFADFKKFISRGNVVDMAIGVIVASAFTAIVTALTNKIIMPCINWLLSLGGAGLDSAYTFLKVVYQTDSNGAFVLDENLNQIIDLSKSIYIDWGAFITAILNFILVAFVLFTVLKIFMNARGYLNKAIKANPTRAERKQLKAAGVNMKNYDEVLKATAEFREKNKPAPVPPKPTQEELLTSILEELKKQNEKPAELTAAEELQAEAKEEKAESAPATEEDEKKTKPVKKTRKKKE
ncbi:MAG: MscL family protein [Clostridia bacterium]|nr:MscL family protein [Clostridia bacterium]